MVKPYARSRSTDTSAWYSGTTLFTFLATGEDTGGLFSLLEARSRKGNEPPPHVHENEDECFYVLAGEGTFQVDGQTFHGRPGTCIFIPRGSVHSFALESDEATVLLLYTPAGFERYFQELSVPATSVTTPPAEVELPDVPHVLSVFAKYGSTVVVPR